MILLIGSEGNIGRRYQAVLKDLGQEFITFDRAKDQQKNFPKPEAYDQAIIASPTDTHYEHCRRMIKWKKRFLCEKPLSKNLAECTWLMNEAKARKVKGFVVNNYYFATYGQRKGHKIIDLEYNFYNHGKDHILWDCCQLIYMCKKARLLATSPVWSLLVNGLTCPYQYVEQGYVDMIDQFTKGVDHMLWTLDAGMKMTEAVLERAKHEFTDWNSKQI